MTPLRPVWLRLAVLLGGAAPLGAVQQIFVAPTGNDAWSGAYAEARADGSGGPVASLGRARDLARSHAADVAGARTREPVEIVVRGGTYRILDTLELTAEDAATAAAPVTWRAYGDEPVLLSGGVEVTGFERLDRMDAGAAGRIRPELRDRIWVTDLRRAGVEDFGVMKRSGFRVPYEPSALRVFYGEEAMTLARYPNAEWERIVTVPQDGTEPAHADMINDRRFDDVPTGRHFGAFTYAGDRPSTWASVDDVWVHGYWTWDWADTTERIAALDATRRRIDLAPPYHPYGLTREQRFYYLNVPEELDAPGEWYLDRERGRLYFWPPDEAFAGTVTVSMLETPLIRVRGADAHRFEGFSFGFTRGPGIEVAEAREVRFTGCRFFGLGGIGLAVTGGARCGVVDSEFFNLASGGVRLDGGDRATLARGEHFVLNCEFRAFGQVHRTNQPAVRLDGVGHRVAYSLIHDAPHMGLHFQGNDHLIEFNEIHDIAKETGDVGAIYSGRDYTSRGTIVRYNYLHDFTGPGLYGVRAVYLDDFTSGVTIYGNVFYRAGKGAFVGGGRDNRIQNNVFIACAPSVHVDARGLSWAANYFNPAAPNHVTTLSDFMAAARVEEAPYAVRYPELVTLYADEPAVPKNNVVTGNVSFGGVFLELFDGVKPGLVTVRDNLVGDPIALRITDQTDQAPEFTTYESEGPAARDVLPGNRWPAAAKADSGASGSAFYRVVDGRVELDQSRLPAGVGFAPISMEEIGLRPRGTVRP